MTRGAADTIDIATYQTGPRPFVAVGIPSFGMVHLFFAARLLNLRMPVNSVVRHYYVIGKEIGEARNEIVAKALAAETQDPSMRCSHVFFLDDDVLCHPYALQKLLTHHRPIVSGLYYAKSSVPTPLVLHGEFGGIEQSWIPGDLVECAGHGMGLTLIDADVFHRVRDECDIGLDKGGHPAWFTTHRDEQIVIPSGVPTQFSQTEDMHFLRLAQSLGYQPAVDTSAEAFGWHLDTRTMSAYPQKQWKEFISTGRVTWETSNGPHVWENAA